jgi:hypothetical protein
MMLVAADSTVTSAPGALAPIMNIKTAGIRSALRIARSY